MTEKHKFNRQEIDFLLTDLLPYEKGNHYTHRYFYEYIQDEKKIFKRLFKNAKKGNKFSTPKWHSAPLKYKISKKKGDFREIGLINPLGLVEALVFIYLFENDVLNIIHNKKDFSVRKAKRTNSLTYKNNKNQIVYYSDLNSKKQLLITLESSGTYFNHYPFKTISELLNSIGFIYSCDKFDLLMSLDIQECFPSIYTHSYKWLISNKSYDSKKIKDSNSVYSNIDTFLQNINGSKTNGILVGPEVSRLLADFLLIHIDQEIIENLAGQDISFGRDYMIYRFVDDYYIHSKDEKTQNIIKDVINNLLNKYHLKINESKISKKSKWEVLNNWKIEVFLVIELIEKIFSNRINNVDEIITTIISKLELPEDYTQLILEVATSTELSNAEYNKKYRVRYIDLRSRVLKTIEISNEKVLVCSYILSTVLRKIEENKNEKIVINMELNEFVTFILFVYTIHVNYSSTQKIIRIFTLLFDKYKYQIDIKEIIERNVERFENDIFTKFPNDWIDLLLFFASYEINISHKLIEKITNIFILEENPLNLAALCIFAESSFVDTDIIIRKVRKIIKKNIERINWNDFFQDEKSWWVYIFLSYPRLSRNLRKFITNKLETVKTNLRNSLSDDAKKFVLDFLLTKNKHYIEWGFTQENYYKNYYFYTQDRTVFNPGVIDQISISR